MPLAGISLPAHLIRFARTQQIATLSVTWIPLSLQAVATMSLSGAKSSKQAAPSATQRKFVARALALTANLRTQRTSAAPPRQPCAAVGVCLRIGLYTNIHSQYARTARVIYCSSASGATRSGDRDANVPRAVDMDKSARGVAFATCGANAQTNTPMT